MSSPEKVLPGGLVADLGYCFPYEDGPEPPYPSAALVEVVRACGRCVEFAYALDDGGEWCFTLLCECADCVQPLFVGLLAERGWATETACIDCAPWVVTLIKETVEGA
jgi:hypothetical protein